MPTASSTPTFDARPSLKQFDLTGRLALVTGSSAGIGYGIARALGHAGASVVLNGRDAKRLDAAVAALQAEGLTVHRNGFDVTDRPAVLAAVDAIVARLG